MRHAHGSILTRAQLRSRHTKDGGGKQLKRRAVFASVTDLRYGIKPLPGLLPQVTVPVPRTKREKYTLGSPYDHIVTA